MIFFSFKKYRQNDLEHNANLQPEFCFSVSCNGWYGYEKVVDIHHSICP